MAVKQLATPETKTALSNQSKLKTRYKTLLSTLDDDIAAISNAATKAAVTKLSKMVKVLARRTFKEADGE